jgi:hypothetical protein
MARIKSNLASRVKKGKMAQEAADAVFARVKGTLDYNDFGSVDMVRLDYVVSVSCSKVNRGSSPINERQQHAHRPQEDNCTIAMRCHDHIMRCHTWNRRLNG